LQPFSETADATVGFCKKFSIYYIVKWNHETSIALVSDLAGNVTPPLQPSMVAQHPPQNAAAPSQSPNNTAALQYLIVVC
jgi:hypothetical protein